MESRGWRPGFFHAVVHAQHQAQEIKSQEFVSNKPGNLLAVYLKPPSEEAQRR
jgi:hypothetical protein